MSELCRNNVQDSDAYGVRLPLSRSLQNSPELSFPSLPKSHPTLNPDAGRQAF